MSRSAKIGILVSVICAVPAAVGLLLASEIRFLEKRHITVIDGA